MQKAAFASYDDFTQSEPAAVSALVAERSQPRQRANRLINDLLRAGKPIAVNILVAGDGMDTSHPMNRHRDSMKADETIVGIRATGLIEAAKAVAEMV